jgi:hypothetical protein
VELENLCAFDFFSLFEVVRMTSQNKEKLLQFHNSAFQHPSYRATSGRYIQGVRQRKQMALIKVFQYDFPDTAEFGGSLRDINSPVTECTEQYCEQALLLFHPLRQLADITLQNSYTLHFRESVANGVIGQAAQNFLQNLQDAKSNSFRVTRLDDDLQRDTEPFNSNNDDCDADAHADEEDTSIVEGQSLDIVLQMLNMEGEAENPTIPESPVINLPSSISLQTIRNKGRLQCGYKSLIDMSMNVQPNATSVVETEMAGTAEVPHTADGVVNMQMSPSQRDIVQLLLTRTTRRTRSFKEISKSDAPVNVLEANGSVRSIID